MIRENDFDISRLNDIYTVGIITANYVNLSDPSNVNLLRSGMSKILSESSHKTARVVGFSEISPAKFIFVSVGATHDTINNAEQLLAKVKKLYNTDTTIAFSRPRRNPTELMSAISEAYKACDREFLEGTNSIYFYDKMHENADSFRNSFSRICFYEEMFVESLLGDKTLSNLRKQIDAFFDELIEARINAQTAWQVCRELLLCVASNLRKTFRDNRAVIDCIDKECNIENVIGTMPAVQMREIFRRKLLTIHSSIRSFSYTNSGFVETLDYLLNSQCENVTLLFVANYMDISPSYLSYAFKKNTGTTFKDYVHRFKMDKAKRMLLFSQLKVSQISRSLGYTDVVNFSRNFKKFYKLSPSDYRRINAKDNS